MIEASLNSNIGFETPSNRIGVIEQAPIPSPEKQKTDFKAGISRLLLFAGVLSATHFLSPEAAAAPISLPSAKDGEITYAVPSVCALPQVRVRAFIENPNSKSFLVDGGFRFEPGIDELMGGLPNQLGALNGVAFKTDNRGVGLSEAGWENIRVAPTGYQESLGIGSVPGKVEVQPQLVLNSGRKLPRVESADGLRLPCIDETKKDQQTPINIDIGLTASEYAGLSEELRRLIEAAKFPQNQRIDIQEKSAQATPQPPLPSPSPVTGWGNPVNVRETEYIVDREPRGIIPPSARPYVNIALIILATIGGIALGQTVLKRRGGHH